MMRLVWVGMMLGAVALSGCTGIETLNRATTPTDLYTLTPKSTFASGLPRIRQQIVVEEPTASSAVNTDQIAVQPTPYQIEYLPRARWVDRAPVIVQNLLVESYENSGKVRSVGRSSVGLRPDYVIVTDLREFQARLPVVEVEGTEALKIDVRLNLKIVDSFNNQIIDSKSFEAVVQTASDEIEDVILAFDTALGRTMRNSVEWSVRSIYSHAQKNPRPALQ
ncbi:membrane integrity-associated transporter subunit PqiC [Shimia sp. R9_1]|uniref:ABC-type transport auxiliary lipoprotein family protein n=1 Tax=Shimia sp. R9_1 TaxID=2821111 RepID=UPI001ADD063E|nr:ABC-type transport auxiliary lipoprotein family protein [Shimia sp. R9_1]MBO9407537.1 membrane integrity-associated transporter subunit PqiC [Shimia sp. R9_1]